MSCPEVGKEKHFFLNELAAAQTHHGENAYNFKIKG